MYPQIPKVNEAHVYDIYYARILYSKSIFICTGAFSMLPFVGPKSSHICSNAPAGKVSKLPFQKDACFRPPGGVTVTLYQQADSSSRHHHKSKEICSLRIPKFPTKIRLSYQVIPMTVFINKEKFCRSKGYIISRVIVNACVLAKSS